MEQARAGRIGLIAVIGCVAFALTAHAYPLPGSGSVSASVPTVASSDLWSSIAAPFENFAGSLQSVGNPTANLPSSSTSTPVPENVTTGIRDAFRSFDAWLYGIAGFHILAIVTVFLDILSWILGFVKHIVDWALGLFH